MPTKRAEELTGDEARCFSRNQTCSFFNRDDINVLGQSVSERHSDVVVVFPCFYFSAFVITFETVRFGI